MNNITLVEAETRKLIDDQLVAAGWVIQDKNRINLVESHGVAIREMDTDTGPADYMLFIDGKACGIIEAKREGTNLGGVAYNRSGEPDAVVELTQRELGTPYQSGFYRENTGLQLHLNCRIASSTSAAYAGYYGCSGTPAWLDRDKLIQLGFDLDTYEADKDTSWLKDKILAKEAYVVLEYDGQAYQQALANAAKKLADETALRDNNPDKKEFERRAEAANTQWQNEQTVYSRLFVIDTGSDKDTLRSQYPDGHRYIILPAVIRPYWDRSNNKHEWSGTISELQLTHINVPLEQRQAFYASAEPNNIENIQSLTTMQDSKIRSPQYKARIAFGKRGEPWLMDVEAM